MAVVSRDTVGWDIGGVNSKAALVRDGRVVTTCTRPFEIQRAPHALPALLRDLASTLGAGHDAVHAVTMTAELSQMFLTKREGVGHVLDALASAFPGSKQYIYGTDGSFHEP